MKIGLYTDTMQDLSLEGGAYPNWVTCNWQPEFYWDAPAEEWVP